jgi:hypothetical protein
MRKGKIVLRRRQRPGQVRKLANPNKIWPELHCRPGADQYRLTKMVQRSKVTSALQQQSPPVLRRQLHQAGAAETSFQL